MTTENPDNDTADGCTDRESSRSEWLRDVICSCKELPVQVRGASLTRVDERVIDTSRFESLAGQGVFAGAGDSLTATLKRRQAALSPFVGKTLICVSILLPGVSYTIEVDPTVERIVHWEWRAI